MSLDAASDDVVIDIRFRAPRSYSLLLSGLVDSGRRLEARTFTKSYEGLAHDTLDVVRRCALAGPLVGSVASTNVIIALLTAVEEPIASGVHHHVLVGRPGGLGDEFDVDGFRSALRRSAWPAYLRRLRETTTAFGVAWGRPGPGAAYEIVEPPLDELLATTQEPRECACPRYGSVTIWLPDPVLEAQRTATERAVQAEVAQDGVSYWVGPVPG